MFQPCRLKGPEHRSEARPNRPLTPDDSKQEQPSVDNQSSAQHSRVAIIRWFRALGAHSNVRAASLLSCRVQAAPTTTVYAVKAGALYKDYRQRSHLQPVSARGSGVRKQPCLCWRPAEQMPRGARVPFRRTEPRDCVFLGLPTKAPAFAVSCFRRWWQIERHERYPQSRHILILARYRRQQWGTARRLAARASAPTMR